MSSEAESGADDGGQPVLLPVYKPFSLVPVGLKEAALDSPSFRAATVHFADQVDAVERWLEGSVKAATRLSQEVTSLESAVQSLVLHTNIPNHLSEASIDQDYTMLALKKYSEGARDFWSHTIGGIKRTQHSVVEPIKNFLASEIKPYKEARRQLDYCQRTYDGLLARYLSQGKGKEPSSLREDAFQVHESRKAYLKACMDICVLAPQVRVALDSLLIKIFTDQWLEMKRIREETSNAFTKSGHEIDRIRAWSKEMKGGEDALRKELLLARREIEKSAELAARPSRDIDTYSASTVPYLTTGAPPPSSSLPDENGLNSKQGYLYMKTISGKPARTSWIRRWCFCKNSVFGWLVQGVKSGGVEESEKIGVLLCAVRPAFQEERRFCFEVKTKDTTTVLQAETQSDLMEWLSVFEIVKRRALEEPDTTDLITSIASPSGDAAFAVNPPTAPEFAAKENMGSLTGATTDEGSSLSLGADLEDLSFSASRSSFDISSLRRGEKDGERERTRDHAARIIHKLDLHKKTPADTQLSGTTTQSSSAAAPIGGGIASLIAASHSSLPVGPGRPPVLQTKDKSLTGPNIASTLAPDTLANPPSQTNLTKTAILLGMDRGFDLGLVDESGGMPSGLMANQWGTINHGQIARIDRGEVRAAELLSSARINGSAAIRAIEQSEVPSSTPGSKNTTPLGSPGIVQLGHRKTLSAADGLAQASNLQPPRRARPFTEFPSYYPASLRAHDAQFRMLFPNIDPDERVVMVFRACWNASDGKDLPARAYVTPQGLYFYSHYYGLVLVSAIGLENVLDVSAAGGQQHDVLYVKVRIPDGRGEETIVPIKTFLDPLPLLQRRLNYLVTNSGSEEPDGLEEIIRQLIAMEKESKDDVPGLLSPDAVSIDPRLQFQGKVKVDRSAYGGDVGTIAENDATKFRLPAHPVNYVPQHFQDCAAERTYNVSAKALFHIMFGDKSALFQLLYRERRAQSVRQSPWTKGDDGRFSRKFEYSIEVKDSLQRTRTLAVADSQVIDVCNDHLCYAVTDLKTPWHLPNSKDFTMISKIVITHVAKSKSKLSTYTKVEWTQHPWLSKSVISMQALDDLHLDALDIMDLVSDQVDKLGPNTYTKKALAIFGPIGVSTEASQIVSADPSILGKPVRLAIKQKSTLGLFLEFIRSVTVSGVSVVLMSMIGLVKAVFRVVNIHRLLIGLLLGSALANLIGSSTIVREWWHDRSTTAFMSRLGVKPDLVLGRALYLKDLHALVPSDVTPSFAGDSQCAHAFQDILERTEEVTNPAGVAQLADSSSRAAARRLKQTRKRFGTYRHDLVVSLRMVNRIEQETVQAEYEHWLSEEAEKCEVMARLLQARSENATGSQHQQQLAAQLGQEDQGLLSGWLEEYCKSCRTEKEMVVSMDRWN